jgi:hypothetical protein
MRGFIEGNGLFSRTFPVAFNMWILCFYYTRKYGVEAYNINFDSHIFIVSYILISHVCWYVHKFSGFIELAFGWINSLLF